METAPSGSYAGYSSGGTFGNYSTDFTSSFLPDGMSQLSSFQSSTGVMQSVFLFLWEFRRSESLKA